MKNHRVITVSILLVTALTACSPSEDRAPTERGRNIDACEQMASLNQEFSDMSDEVATMSDMDRLIHDFLDSQVAIGQSADTPMGNWMVEDAEAVRAVWESGDTGEEEDMGSNINNGLTVEPQEGSLVSRCENLGVDVQ